MTGRDDFSDKELKYISATRFWVRFVAVLGYLLLLFLTLCIVTGIALIGPRTALTRTLGRLDVFFLVFGIGYLALASIYSARCRALFRFADRISAVLEGDYSAVPDGVGLELALRRQAGFWRFTGVCVLLAIRLELVVFFWLAILASAAGTTA